MKTTSQIAPVLVATDLSKRYGALQACDARTYSPGAALCGGVSRACSCCAASSGRACKAACRSFVSSGLHCCVSTLLVCMLVVAATWSTYFFTVQAVAEIRDLTTDMR